MYALTHACIENFAIGQYTDFTKNHFATTMPFYYSECVNRGSCISVKLYVIVIALPLWSEINLMQKQYCVEWTKQRRTLKAMQKHTYSHMCVHIKIINSNHVDLYNRHTDIQFNSILISIDNCALGTFKNLHCTQPSNSENRITYVAAVLIPTQANKI